MPEPLAMPAMWTVLPPSPERATQHLGTVSVVMIARATEEASLLERFLKRDGSCRVIFSALSGTPMTPVEAMRTCCGLTASSFAVSLAVRSAALAPSLPVHALALPAFTTTARAWPRLVARCRRQSSTGAAAATLVVKTPAAEVPSSSETMRARSSAPFFFLMSAAAAAARNPCGVAM